MKRPVPPDRETLMAILCDMDEGTLVVRSVGDQTLEEGLAQLDGGIQMAQDHYDATGEAVDLFFDMVDSEESKNSDELGQVVSYLATRCPPLSGRVALAAPKDLMFGLSRIFSSRASISGIESRVCRTREEARAWLEAG